jgi:hypothetical protein
VRSPARHGGARVGTSVGTARRNWLNSRSFKVSFSLFAENTEGVAERKGSHAWTLGRFDLCHARNERHARRCGIVVIGSDATVARSGDGAGHNRDDRYHNDPGPPAASV